MLKPFSLMYNLPYYKEKDEEQVIAFVQQHPFAMLVGTGTDGQPVATQIPVFIDRREDGLYLSGHMMRNTDHYNAFSISPQALVIFTGPHAYVSSSWYSTPHTASTWNYMTVHARGSIRFTDKAALLGILQRTQDYFENNPASGANFKDLPDDYVQRLAGAIAGFEIRVEQLDHVFKLSQNRDQESYQNIIDNLQAQGGDAAAIAWEMRKRASQLFNEK